MQTTPGATLQGSTCSTRQSRGLVRRLAPRPHVAGLMSVGFVCDFLSVCVNTVYHVKPPAGRPPGPRSDGGRYGGRVPPQTPLSKPDPPEKRNPHLPTPLEACYRFSSEVAQPPSGRLLLLLGGRYPAALSPAPLDDVAGVFSIMTPSSSPSATGVQGKDGVGSGRGVPSPRHRKSEARRRIFRELVHIATEQGSPIPLRVSTGDALQDCLDRAVSLWRFAADQVDSLIPPALADDDEDLVLSTLPVQEDPLFEVIPNPQGPDLIQRHRYILMEEEARKEIEKLAAMMTQLGIAERVVRVREAEAALFAAAVRDAALEAGIPHDKVRLLGSKLRDRLTPAPDNQTPSPLQASVPNRGTVGPGQPVIAAARDVERSLETGE